MCRVLFKDLVFFSVLNTCGPNQTSLVSQHVVMTHELHTHTHTHTPLLTSHPPGFLRAPPSLLCLHVHLQIISTHTHICTDKHKATACSEHVVIIWRHPVREVRTGLGTGPRERNLPSRPATGWFTELFRYLFTYLFMHTSMIDEAQNYSTTIWP